MNKLDRVLRKLGFPVQAWKRPRTPLDIELAGQILSQAGLCDQVLDVQEIYAGWNTMYLVKTDGQSYCFRVFTNDFAGYGTDWKPAKEKYVLDLLCQNGVKAPRAYYADSSDSLLGHPYIVMEYKLGISARRAAREHTLSDADRYQIFHEAGQQMALIHSIDMPELGVLDYRLRSDSTWNLECIVEQYVSKCPKCSNRDKIDRYLRDVSDLVSGQPRLVSVHTELTDRNLLVLPYESWRLSSVVDIEWFMRSVPEHEFARLTVDWLQFDEICNDLESGLAALLSGYYESGGRLSHPEAIPGFVVFNQFLIRQPSKIKRKRLDYDLNRLMGLEKIVQTYEAVIAKLQ